MAFVPLAVLLSLRPNIDRAALDAVLAASNLSAPAVYAAVVKDGKTVWTGRKGTASGGTFRIGSLTKAFTATIILQLVNERKLSLDDPVSKFLPTLPKAWEGATVRHLLNHTSGIPDYTSQPDFLSHITERFTPAGIVALTADKPLDFPPGSQYRYDNTGYVILGEIVETLDHRSFAESLQRRILKPLGLRHTRLNVGGVKAEVAGFQAEGKPAIAINMSIPYSAGSIVSTIEDMAKWLAAQGSTRLLPAALWAEMWKPGVLHDGKTTEYGFGWVLKKMNGVPTLEHNGGIPGFVTDLARVPSKGLACIVLTNSDGSAPHVLTRRLLETVDSSLKENDVAIPDPDPKVTDATLRMLRGFEQGDPDKGAMTSALASVVDAAAIAALRDTLGLLGKLRELRLVAIDGPKRTYRAHYENATLKIVIVQDGESRFAMFGLSPA